MTTATDQKILKKNTDGNIYGIPASMEHKFIELDEEVQNAVFGSGQWFDACEKFNRTFDCWMK